MIIAAAAITSIVILDLLATRQILPVDSFGENIIFILTVFVAYGIGSLILFSWSNKISREIRKKSLSINIVHYGTWMTQFILLVIMTLIIFFNGPVLLNSSVYLISSISSTFILPDKLEIVKMVPTKREKFDYTCLWFSRIYTWNIGSC